MYKRPNLPIFSGASKYRRTGGDVNPLQSDENPARYFGWVGWRLDPQFQRKKAAAKPLNDAHLANL
jgi:hypothetical protein